jgi:hypothetical protein
MGLLLGALVDGLIVGPMRHRPVFGDTIFTALSIGRFAGRKRSSGKGEL